MKATKATAAPARPHLNHAMIPETGFVRLPVVMAHVPFSEATIWRKVRTKEFPQPVKLSERVTAWRAEDLRAWIDARATPKAA